MKELRFWRCPLCGRIVYEVEASDTVPVCCGREMTLLKPNTGAGLAEKHVPLVKRSGDTLTVKVSALPHPAMPAHRIEWVALQCADRVGFCFIEPGEAPEAQFRGRCIEPEAAYAYCNIHGLWKGAVDKA